MDLEQEFKLLKLGLLMFSIEKGYFFKALLDEWYFKLNCEIRFREV